MKIFKLAAEIPKLGIVKTDAALCESETEALYRARDFGWQLYMENEGTEELPSWDVLAERYHGEWFDLIDSEFERALDDLYVRTIESSVVYWIEEVK